MKKTNRTKEIEQAFIELKRVIRNSGRSVITSREIEEIFVKFNIKLN